MKYFLVLMIFFSFSLSANAAHIDCGYNSVGLLYVIGSRTDGSSNNNRVQVNIPLDCVEGKSFGFVDNDEASYQGVLAMLLAAKMSSTPIRIMVDDAVTTANSVRIVWVNFE